MTLYFNKKRFIVPFISSILLFLVSLVILNYIESVNFYTSNPSTELVLLFFFGGSIAIAGPIGACVNLFHLVRPKKVALTIYEEGIFIGVNRSTRKAGLIKWDEISKIEKSTDNMNKPAVRVTLKNHRNGSFQFFINCKQVGITQDELMNFIGEYYKIRQQ